MIKQSFVVALVMYSGIAVAADPEPRKECADLQGILRTAVGQFITGDYSNRVRIALEAHRRLECPTVQLLEVLNINIDKAPKKGSN